MSLHCTRKKFNFEDLFSEHAITVVLYVRVPLQSLLRMRSPPYHGGAIYQSLGGVTAGAVMTLFGQSRRDTQRPIGPIISYWNVRTMAEATRVGQVHVAMEMKEYGTEVLGISEARLGHMHCTQDRGCRSDGERKTTTTWRRTEEKEKNQWRLFSCVTGLNNSIVCYMILVTKESQKNQ